MLPGRSSARGVALVVASFTGVATAACSLIVSTDGLTSDDAGSDAAAETSADAPNDVVITDAHDENAIDAAPALPFCVANATALFCDDFDNGPLGGKWDSQQTGGGSITLDPTQFRSSPYSALFNASGSASVVNLERDLAASSGSYRVAFALRVATAPAPGSAYQIIARISNGNGAELELYEDSGGFSVNDRIGGAYGTYYSAVNGITIGAWTDFVIHLNFAPAGGMSSASIDLDGTNVVPMFQINSAFDAPSAVGLLLGIPYGSGSSTSVSIDNVKISTE